MLVGCGAKGKGPRFPQAGTATLTSIAINFNLIHSCESPVMIWFGDLLTADRYESFSRSRFSIATCVRMYCMLATSCNRALLPTPSSLLLLACHSSSSLPSPLFSALSTGINVSHITLSNAPRNGPVYVFSMESIML